MSLTCEEGFDLLPSKMKNNICYVYIYLLDTINVCLGGFMVNNLVYTRRNGLPDFSEDAEAWTAGICGTAALDGPPAVVRRLTGSSEELRSSTAGSLLPNHVRKKS